MVFTFEYPELPLRYNQLARGVTWKKNKAERIKWSNRIAREMQAQKLRLQSPLTRAQIQCIRYSSVAPDYDGLVSSFKFVIDSLVLNGIIRNDDMRTIGMPYFTWKRASPGKGKILVTVLSVDPVLKNSG